MNKKAAIILISASLAFFIASVIFLNTQLKTPNILGEAQLEILNLPKEAELYMAYIENAAKFALAETMKMNPPNQKDFYTLCSTGDELCNDLPQYFKATFSKHIKSFNKAYDQKIDISNYKFESMSITRKQAIETTGVSTDKIKIKKGENIVYMVEPNFKIQATLEELNELSTTPETIAIAFLYEVADKFKKCWEENKDKKKNCYCRDSEIKPSELPEGYTISIITTAEIRKQKPLEEVNYQFKLLEKENKVVKHETLKGIFGAYEHIKNDLENKLCYPGAFSIDKGYVTDKNSEKGKLYFFEGAANCAGVAEFLMVEYVKESEFGNFEGRPDCPEIGKAF